MNLLNKSGVFVTSVGDVDTGDVFESIKTGYVYMKIENIASDGESAVCLYNDDADLVGMLVEFSEYDIVVVHKATLILEER